MLFLDYLLKSLTIKGENIFTEAFMLITKKGQVTIPIQIREQFSFLPHTEVDFIVEDNRVILQKTTHPSKKANPFESLIGVASSNRIYEK